MTGRQLAGAMHGWSVHPSAVWHTGTLDGATHVDWALHAAKKWCSMSTPRQQGVPGQSSRPSHNTSWGPCLLQSWADMHPSGLRLWS
jgi:hypothetical protein